MSFIATLQSFVRPLTHSSLIVDGKAITSLSWIMKECMDYDSFDTIEYSIARGRQALRERLVKEEDITAYFPLPDGTTEEFWIDRHEMRSELSESEWNQRFAVPDDVIRMKHYARIYDALHPKRVKSTSAAQRVAYIKQGLPGHIWELVSEEVTNFILENPANQLKLNRSITKPKWIDDIECFKLPNLVVGNKNLLPISYFIRSQKSVEQVDHIERLVVGARRSARELGASELVIEANYPLPEGTTEEFWVDRYELMYHGKLAVSEEELNRRFPIPPQAVRLEYYTALFEIVEEINGEFQSLSREERVERVREENTDAVPDHVLEVLLDLARK